MEQYLPGAAKLQDSQQPLGAGANSRLSLKLLIGRERRTGRELASTLEHSSRCSSTVAARGSPMLKEAAACLAGDGRDGQALHRVIVIANQVEQQVKEAVKVGQSDGKLHICVELHLSVCY
jgi:uncharacterized membrane protein